MAMQAKAREIQNVQTKQLISKVLWRETCERGKKISEKKLRTSEGENLGSVKD